MEVWKNGSMEVHCFKHEKALRFLLYALSLRCIFSTDHDTVCSAEPAADEVRFQSVRVPRERLLLQPDYSPQKESHTLLLIRHLFSLPLPDLHPAQPAPYLKNVSGNYWPPH